MDTKLDRQTAIIEAIMETWPFAASFLTEYSPIAHLFADRFLKELQDRGWSVLSTGVWKHPHSQAVD